MRDPFRRAVVLSCAAGVSLGAPTATLGAMPFDPTAQGIDRVCDAYAPAAAPRDKVFLQRMATHDGSTPAWQRSDPAANERLRAASAFSGADFATVYFDRGSIVVASTLHVDEPEGARQARSWCFIGGKLSRATSDNIDASNVGWRRSVYYGDDLEKPLSEYTTQIPPSAASDRHARPPLSDLGVDAYGTPAQLPMYAAAVAAHPSAPRKR